MVALIAVDPRLLSGGGWRRPPLLALPRGTLRARDQCATLVRAGAVRMRNIAHSNCRVGKGAGTAFPCGDSSRAPCPRVTSRSNKNAWAQRTRALICGTAVPAPLPTLRCGLREEHGA